MVGNRNHIFISLFDKADISEKTDMYIKKFKLIKYNKSKCIRPEIDTTIWMF